MESEIAIEIRGKMKSDSVKQAVHINGDLESDFAPTQALDIVNQDSETKSAFQALGINGDFEADFVAQVFDINLDSEIGSDATQSLEISEDSETVSIAEDPVPGEGGLNRSRSSSSSSSSSSFTGSSSEECFQLGGNETDDTSLGSISDDDNNALTTMPLTSSQPNRVNPPTLTLGNNSSSTSPTPELNHTTPLPRTGQDNENVAFTNTTNDPPSVPPKVTFPVAVAPVEQHKGSRTEIEASLKTAMPSHLSSVVPLLTTQLPPTQAMERPNNEPSSYRIPSYVFARTNAAAAEWSTASNESLFSIHMGNMSFNGDQYFFYQGKSGELGLPSPNKPAAVLGKDFQAAEAKAAETMREVIRESAENKAKEEAEKKKSSSSSISRQSEDSVKSFAFPVLAGDGEKSVSVKGGAAKKEGQPQTGELKATLVAAEDTAKTTQIAVHNRWNSYSCFTCFRSSCY